MPLSLLLDEGPRRIAEIVGANVASLYLLEGRAASWCSASNVGLAGARAACPLAVGEGHHRHGRGVHAAHLGHQGRRARAPLPRLPRRRHARRGSLPGLPRRARARGAAGSGRARRWCSAPRIAPSTRATSISSSPSPRPSPPASATPSSSTRRPSATQSRRTGGGHLRSRSPACPTSPERGAPRRHSPRCAVPRPSPATTSAARIRALLRAAFDAAGKALGALVVRAGQLADMSEEARFLSTYLLLVSAQPPARSALGSSRRGETASPRRSRPHRARGGPRRQRHRRRPLPPGPRPGTSKTSATPS